MRLLDNFPAIDEGIGIDLNVQSLLDTFGSIPDLVTLVRIPQDGTHLCFCLGADETFGLACFSNKTMGGIFLAQYGHHLDVSVEDTEFDEMSRDDALDLARSKPMPITALILLDNPTKPIVQYVKGANGQ